MLLPNSVDVASWSLLWTDTWVLNLAHKSRCVGHICINLLKLIISVCHIRKNWMGAPWALRCSHIIIKTRVNNMASWFLSHFEGKMKRHSLLFRSLWAVWRYCSWDEILVHQGVLHLYIHRWKSWKCSVFADLFSIFHLAVRIRQVRSTMTPCG